MKIVSVELSKLKSYGGNAKIHTKEQIEEIKASIERFGMNDPIGIWGPNNLVVEGHGRLEALKQLGAKRVDCIRLDHLTDDERRAYTLVHNKLNADTGVDQNKLQIELNEINEVDMGEFNFDVSFDVQLPEIEKDRPEYYGDERERTVRAYNIDDIDLHRTTGKYQMPIIRKTNHVPKDLISFNYVLSTDAFNKGVHFYIDDYQFERLWNAPDQYLPRLARFDCCLTPEFSCYTNMPIAMQIWNVFRSRLIGQIMQNYGIIVIPTVIWSYKDSFDFCFDGIEPGGVISVSTIGCVRKEYLKDMWFAGMDEAIRRLSPKRIIVYGSDIGYDYKDVPVKFINNHNAERLRGE